MTIRDSNLYATIRTLLGRMRVIGLPNDVTLLVKYVIGMECGPEANVCLSQYIETNTDNNYHYLPLEKSVDEIIQECRI